MAISDRADLTQKQNDNELLRRELMLQRHAENQIGYKKPPELQLTQKDEPGVKHDAGKPRLDLIPSGFLVGIGTVFDYGATKYGCRNFEKGMSWGRCFGALLRHLFAWWGGEELDPETKYPHLWHAGCCIAMLEFYRSKRIGTDDRSVT